MQPSSLRAFSLIITALKLRRAKIMDYLEELKLEEMQRELAKDIATKIIFCTKEVLTADEAAKYMGVSKSYLYKLTGKKEIPHYKPMGKMCYFNRKELEAWLQRNKIELLEG
jgi:excisionase family DNA binding protein